MSASSSSFAFSAFLFHVGILLSATCGLPFVFTYLHYFAASASCNLVTFVTVNSDNTQVVHWYQTKIHSQLSTSPDTLTSFTLIPVASPPIDWMDLEDYYYSSAKPFTASHMNELQITLQRSSSHHNNVCFEYKARPYCSSDDSPVSLFSKRYIHAPTGESIRIRPASIPKSVTSVFPSASDLDYTPTTYLLLLLQTILAIAYWNARLSPSAVGLLLDNNMVQEEPWRLLTGATAHFDVWHFGMNMMTLSSLGTALENKTIFSMAFLAINLSMMVYTGMCWWVIQSLLLRVCRNPAPTNHPQNAVPTVGYSGVLFAWLVVLAMEHGTVCPVFFLPQLCFSSVHIGKGFSIHPGPLIQLILMQLVLPRASWTGHLAGIVVGWVYQWQVLPVAMWWPSLSIPWMHFVWCLRQKRQRFLAQRHGLLSWHNSYSVYIGIVHGVLWVSSILTLGGFGSKMALEYLMVVLWWHSTRSDDTTMARGFILLSVLVLVTNVMTAAAWMVVFSSVWTTIIPSVVTLLLRIVALLISLVWMIHSHRLYQEVPSGIFYYVFHWNVLKPSHGILVAIGATTNRTTTQESSWDQLGTGRRLDGTRDQEMVQLL